MCFFWQPILTPRIDLSVSCFYHSSSSSIITLMETPNILFRGIVCSWMRRWEDLRFVDYNQLDLNRWGRWTPKATQNTRETPQRLLNCDVPGVPFNICEVQQRRSWSIDMVGGFIGNSRRHGSQKIGHKGGSGVNKCICPNYKMYFSKL